jgi:transposase
VDEILSGCEFSRRRRHLACAEVIARLVAPGSELATSSWVGRTALGLLLHDRLSYLNKDALYRVSDQLWGERERIEAALAGSERTLFALQECFILYDLSSTYFEGLCPFNPKAQRGYSRDHRADCKQVVVGMVLDETGFPKATEIYEGNTVDKSTMRSMVEGLQRRVGKREVAPTVVMDRGVATEENLKLLKEAGYHYLVGCASEERDEWIGVLKADQFRHVEAAGRDHPGVEVCLRKREGEAFLFVRSPLRVQKDRQIRERFVTRMQEALQRLSTQIESGRIKDPQKIQRKIGKLQERNKRAARFFRITLYEDQEKTELSWTIEDKKLQQAELLDGCYTLKTDRGDVEEDTFWPLYTMLNRVERSFRYLKSSLGIRPNYHQLERRVEGHIFISVLAYHLLHAAEQMLLGHNDHRSWPTIKGELDTHRVITLRLTDSEGRVHHRQMATNPTDAQKEIYWKLRLAESPLPNRGYVLDQTM